VMPPVRYDASIRWGAVAPFRSSHSSVGFETRFSGSDGNTIWGATATIVNELMAIVRSRS